jgi:dTDP-4-dehydrorhamnose 3,5-epimerase
VFPDGRGHFLETYKYSEFEAAGITDRFVQENHSVSTRDVVRGLHYQKGTDAQGKLVQAVHGEIFDVFVDLRPGAPTFGQWQSVILSAENKLMVYIPPWCAHGFCVLSDDAELTYKVTREYAPQSEAGVRWNDPYIGIEWPVRNPILSSKDEQWPFLRGVDALPLTAGAAAGSGLRHG